MLLIPCPHCGERAQVEFAYGGDATKRRPSDDAPDEAWYDYVYLRGNPRGPHEEWWLHHAGCGRWIRVTRDTATHEVLAAAPAVRSPVPPSSTEPGTETGDASSGAPRAGPGRSGSASPGPAAPAPDRPASPPAARVGGAFPVRSGEEGVNPPADSGPRTGSGSGSGLDAGLDAGPGAGGPAASASSRNGEGRE